MDGVQNHGIISAVAWGLLLPLGVMAARYIRPFSGSNPAWFYIHVTCQCLGYIFGVIAWALGMRLHSLNEGAIPTKHRNLGISIFALATLQVIKIYQISKPKNRNCMVCNWILSIFVFYFGFRHWETSPSIWYLHGCLCTFVRIFYMSGACAVPEAQTGCQIPKVLERVSPLCGICHHRPHHHQHLRGSWHSTARRQVDHSLHHCVVHIGRHQPDHGNHHLERVASPAWPEQYRGDVWRPIQRHSHRIPEWSQERTPSRGCCLKDCFSMIHWIYTHRAIFAALILSLATSLVECLDIMYCRYQRLIGIEDMNFLLWIFLQDRIIHELPSLPEKHHWDGAVQALGLKLEKACV